MLNVLIVEDNDAYRQSLRRLLAARYPAVSIAEAADGEEALDQALGQRFDVIFMDIRLPNANGLELTRAIKAVYAASRICIVSTHAIVEYRDAAFRCGADHFLVKGDSTEKELLDLVDSWSNTPGA